MNNKQEPTLKWSSNDISRFLLVYRKYESLWDTANENFMRKNARQNNMTNLRMELNDIGFQISNDELLKKKIKNIKDAYRHEANKVKKSMKSGAGAEDIYKPKLNWFHEADAFLRNVMTGRESSSNLVSTSTMYILPCGNYLLFHVIII